MSCENINPFYSQINVARLMRHNISLRFLGVLLTWNLILFVLWLIMDWGVSWFLILTPLSIACSFLCMWSNLAAMETVRFWSALIVLDDDGVLSARWGMIMHRWRENQWYYDTRKSERVIVVKWPWCLFATYTVFPLPYEE